MANTPPQSFLARLVSNILVVPGAFFCFVFFSAAVFGMACSSLNNPYLCSDVGKGSLRSTAELCLGVALFLLFTAWHFGAFGERSERSRLIQAALVTGAGCIPFVLRLVLGFIFG